ncbi:MAG: RNA polymerase sigma factor [Chitinophagaceae bacterium]
MEVVNKYTESELVDLLQKRYQSAFNYLYDNYSAALYSVLVTIIGRTEIADDVLQEVFVKIWKQIDTYDSSKGRLYTWMLNITRNAAIDAVRSKQYKQEKQMVSTENVPLEDVFGTTQLMVDAIGLRKMVHELKDDYKQLIELAYFQGYTQDEMAKILQLPLGTVKSRMRLALIQLRNVMKQQ